MKSVLSLVVGVAFVAGLATAGFAGGDKSGASASGTVSGSGSVSASPSTGGQDKVSGQDASKSGQDASASPKTSGQDKSATGGQDKGTSTTTSGSASPATGGQDKVGTTSTHAAPVSKDECMKDGWNTFGERFKNQCECVSSIVSNSPKKQQQ